MAFRAARREEIARAGGGKLRHIRAYVVDSRERAGSAAQTGLQMSPQADDWARINSP